MGFVEKWKAYVSIYFVFQKKIVEGQNSLKQSYWALFVPAHTKCSPRNPSKMSGNIIYIAFDRALNSLQKTLYFKSKYHNSV